jgi:hypothetical protein
MKVDMDKLSAAVNAARARRKPLAGVAALIASLRSDPATRESIPLETVPLAPVPWRDEGPWRIVVMLAVRTTESNAPCIRRPWGYAEWTVGADGRAAGTPSITRFADDAKYNAVVSRVPDHVSYDNAAAARGLRTLYGAIDPILAADAILTPGLAHLAPLYDGVLPVELDILVHRVAPGSEDWLER